MQEYCIINYAHHRLHRCCLSNCCSIGPGISRALIRIDRKNATNYWRAHQLTQCNPIAWHLVRHSRRTFIHTLLTFNAYKIRRDIFAHPITFYHLLQLIICKTDIAIHFTRHSRRTLEHRLIGSSEIRTSIYPTRYLHFELTTARCFTRHTPVT